MVMKLSRNAATSVSGSSVESVNTELDGSGRVLVRPSGTEPVIRVLAEAETAESAEGLCAKVAALVTHELG